MAWNDSITLRRGQWIDVRFGGDEQRLLVDHPLNARLIGVRGVARVLRCFQFTLQYGDRRVVVYSPRSGSSRPVATAAVVKKEDGGLCLMKWRMEPGFGLQSRNDHGRIAYQISSTEAEWSASADAPAGI
jgi:hypothetical protein